MAEKVSTLDIVHVPKGAARPSTQKKKALTVKLDEMLYKRLVDYVASLRPALGKDISNQVVLERALRRYLDSEEMGT